MNLNFIKTEKLARNIFILFLVGLFLAMLVLNSIVLPVSDDFGASALKSPADVIKRAVRIYFNWDGRAMGSLINGTFLALPKLIFNIANSLLYVWLIVLIYIFACPSKKYDLILFAFIASAVWCFVPVFGEVVFWITGSGYIWGTVITLTYMLPFYFLVLHGKDFKKQMRSSILMFVAGMLSGSFSQNMTGMCVMFIVFGMISLKVRGKKIPVWMWTGMAGMIIGLIFVMISPGNYIRLNAILTNFEAASLGMSPFAIGTKFFHITNFICNDLLYLVLVFTLLFILMSVTNKDKKKIVYPAACIIAGLTGLYVFVLTPIVMEKRAGFAPTIILIIAASYCFANVKLKAVSEKVITHAVAAFMILWFASSFLYAGMDLVYTRISENQRTDSIRAAASKGVKNVVTYFIEYRSEFTKYNPLYAQPSITGSTGHWVNKGISRDLGIDSVHAVRYQEWEHAYKNGVPELMNCHDFGEYLNLLNNGDYIVLTAMSGMHVRIDADIEEKLSNAGLYISSQSSVRANFLSVSDAGEIIFQESSDEPVYYTGAINDIPLSLACNYAESRYIIKLDSYDYSKNRDGISFIVYDKVTGRVADSVVFLADEELTTVR